MEQAIEPSADLEILEHLDTGNACSTADLPEALPRHVAVIMDGNGRWAGERGLPRLKGHEAGAETVRAIAEESAALGIDYLTVYAFSTENWRRPAEEVGGLWMLLEHFIAMETPTLMRNNMRLQTIGRTHELPESCQAALRESISLTARNSGTTLVLALNYSGRAELADAVRAIVREAIEGRIQPEEVTSELIDQHLYTAGIPDPDLLIRTSGEMRLSNFLLWQCSYTEFYITETLWPDFTREEFRRAISDFGKRDRRFGGLQKHGKATTDSDR